MFIAVLATLVSRKILNWDFIILGIASGAILGTVAALKVNMTGMPQFVALLNGLGGLASLIIGALSLRGWGGEGFSNSFYGFIISVCLSGIIGSITFWGSIVGFAKFEGIISERSIVFKGQKYFNILLFTIIIASAFVMIKKPYSSLYYYVILTLFSSVLGVSSVLPVGGADMPVIISLLNSFSGLAASATGFVLQNTVLVISGSLVGASGIILTYSMCRAMNRSVLEVLSGISVENSKNDNEIYNGRIKATTPEEVAMLLESARKVVIVPGYGMAAAQAQHAVKELVNELEKRGVETYFAIHPVAGRMPGHMNVILAEVEIPYEKLKGLEEGNQILQLADVAIVVGANDVVNPLARENNSNPLSGMPILNVDSAKSVVIIKRSLSPGFAGIPNPLFVKDNAILLFDDARKALFDIVSSLRGN
uniref:NAD(P) transhydrogenase subunit beta n=1 Tax=uncultured prokaryote TaxID=198431 RepID=H5SPZ9_9ZZZZ|nr:NAD(P) transhydrogenase subunit beta [uncultured prokaryote]